MWISCDWQRLVCAAHPTQAQGFWPSVVQGNENTGNRYGGKRGVDLRPKSAIMPHSHRAPCQRANAWFGL
jgi:hypothetical protein